MSNILQNPFANAKMSGPTFTDPNKQAPTQQQTARNNAASITNTNANDGFVPDDGDNNNQTRTQNDEGSDPMLDFGKLWEDTPVDPKNPPKEFKGYLPDIDPVKFNEQLSKLDFSRAIPQDVMEGILKGGEDAAKAYPQLINHLGRQMFAMNFNSNSKMMQSALSNVESRFMDELIPSQINNRLVDDSVYGGNPLANDPKYKPMFESVKAQYSKKFPKATPQQINEATKAYMDDFVKTASAPKQTQIDNSTLLKKGDGSANWEDWITTK